MTNSGSTMTGRKRVLTTLDHREPDRVPFDLGGTFVTSIHHASYARLRAALGLAGPGEMIDVRLGLARIEQDVRDALGTDVGYVSARPPSPGGLATAVVEGEEYDALTDEFGMGWKRPRAGGLYFSQYVSPLADAATAAEVRRYPWPDPRDPVRFVTLRADCEQVIATEGRAVACKGMVAGLMEAASWMRGMEAFFMDLLEDPPIARAILDEVLQVKLSYWDEVLTRAGDVIDVVYEADDYGGQKSLLISPAAWRREIKPRLRILCEHIHARSKARIFLHSDGPIREIIPDLIEIGIDILNPVQFTLPGMELEALKSDFGRDLTFWGGGVDTQHVLPLGSPEEVAAQVHQAVQTMKPGGGYVFATIHNIQADVPAANILAVREAFASAADYS